MVITAILLLLAIIIIIAAVIDYADIIIIIITLRHCHCHTYHTLILSLPLRRYYVAITPYCVVWLALDIAIGYGHWPLPLIRLAGCHCWLAIIVTLRHYYYVTLLLLLLIGCLILAIMLILPLRPLLIIINTILLGLLRHRLSFITINTIITTSAILIISLILLIIICGFIVLFSHILAFAILLTFLHYIHYHCIIISFDIIITPHHYAILDNIDISLIHYATLSLPLLLIFITAIITLVSLYCWLYYHRHIVITSLTPLIVIATLFNITPLSLLSSSLLLLCHYVTPFSCRHYGYTLSLPLLFH